MKRDPQDTACLSVGEFVWVKYNGDVHPAKVLTIDTGGFHLFASCPPMRVRDIEWWAPIEMPDKDTGLTPLEEALIWAKQPKKERYKPNVKKRGRKSDEDDLYQKREREVPEEANILRHRLVVARRRLKLTQDNLAQRAGMSAMSIKSYESRKRYPRKDGLRRLAEALETTPEWLTGSGDEDEPDPSENGYEHH